MPSKPRIFVSRTIPQDPLEKLQTVGDVVVWDSDMPPPRAKLLDELALADAAVVMLTEKIDREALDAAPKLKVISNYAVGVDNISIDLATERGIPIGNTPGVLTDTTADLAFALLLATARRIPEGISYVRNGDWQTWNPIQLLGQDVHGATLGIIGLGRIGYATAKRARGFDMNILYHGGSTPEFAERTQAQAVDLDTLLRESDFVSVHTPLTPETEGMIGERELSLMKPTATLINTARGAIVQTNALIVALQNGVIASAALDVTDPEPLPASHPLLALDNCIVIPHVGSATWQTRIRMGMIAAENVIAGLNGTPLPHCVNPTVYK